MPALFIVNFLVGQVQIMNTQFELESDQKSKLKKIAH